MSPRMMHPDHFEEVIYLFHRFVEEMDDKMYICMKGQHREEVTLSAPQFILDILSRALANRSQQSMELTSHFQGIKTVPNYEMAIVLFHNNYPIYREPWMIKKILLEPGVTTKEEWYTKTVVKMKEMYPIKSKFVSDN